MKISVVMPSYNQGRFVKAALDSVLAQDYPHKEILFVDGGSTDETMSVVDSYRDKLAYCVSEKDDGQSDALEKGFARASGDVLTWLNTDDLLLPGALSEVAAAFGQSADCEWVLGNVVRIDEAGRVLDSRKGEAYSPFLGPRFGILTACGPSAFFSQQLYDRVGRINRNFHFMMDTELWWRFAMSGAKFKRLRRYTWALRLHEGAKTSSYMFAAADDPRQVEVAQAQLKELAQIEHMTRPYRLPVPRALSTSVRLARRLASVDYLKGRYEGWMWRGRHVAQVAAAPWLDVL